jgi:hypothetical protein
MRCNATGSKARREQGAASFVRPTSQGVQSGPGALPAPLVKSSPDLRWCDTYFKELCPGGKPYLVLEDGALSGQQASPAAGRGVSQRTVVFHI